MYISIDIGGTTAKIAISTTIEEINDFHKDILILTHNFTKDFSLLKEQINKLTRRNLNGIGISIVGRLSRDKTFLEFAKNLPEWANQPIVADLEKTFHCPVVMDNDAVAAGLGEYYFGEKDQNEFYLIIWGTGLGGAKVSATPTIHSEKLDWNTYFASWENDCGGKKIAEHFHHPASELSENQWQIIMDNFQKYLKEFIIKTNTKKIIFSGGIAKRQFTRLQDICKNMPIDIHLSSLGEDSGLYGGFALLKNVNNI